MTDQPTSPLRVVFRLDASSRIGTGHLARGMTLGRALAAEGFEVAYAMRAPTEHSRAWVAREGFRLVDVAEGDEIATSVDAASGAHLVVVDGYHFTPGLLAAVRREGRVVATIDDLADRELPVDAVINGNLYGADLPYAMLAPGAALLVGPDYALVRDEFRDARVARLRREAAPGPEARPRLLVTLGGADPTCETEKALEALDLLRARGVAFEAVVVVGGANPRAAELVRRASRLGEGVRVLVDVRTMGELMVEADLALTAAGSTCLELACVGVPLVAVVVAENQRGVAAAVATRGLGRSLGESEDVTKEAMAEAVAALLADAPERAAMAARQRATVDGGGAARVAGALAALVRAPK